MESFEPFRVVGSVCGEVPVSATLLYGTPLLMVATGRTFQLFKGKELAMLRGGPTFAEPVRAVAQAGKYRMVAEGPRIHVFVHHKPLWTHLHEAQTGPLVTHLLAQDDLLFSVGSDKRVVVWETKTGVVLNELLVKDSETVTCLALLPGYANKVLLATAEGSLQLYNYKTGQCLWHSQRGAPAVTALACSRYKDLVAYGTAAGQLTVLNVATDEVITTFDHADGGAITSVVFRADKDSLVVSGSSLGDVVVWDLESRAMDGTLTRSKQVRSEQEVLDRPHVDAVHSLVVFELDALAPMLVTGGADNALLQFRFDTVDGLGVLVRERRGHMGSCTTAMFYNNELLVTAGNDRAVRVTHVFSDRASWELSQGKLGKKGKERNLGREAVKLPPATELACCTTRNYQWASVVTLHAASAQTCGWRMDSRALDFKLSAVQTSAHTARSVCMSDCGNYAVVGYSSGNVAVMNLQNKSIRHFFDPCLTRSRVGADLAHEGSVECVEVACGNTTVVSAGLDGTIKYWDLWTGKLKTTVRTGRPVTKSCMHQVSSLLITAQHHTIVAYHANPDVGLPPEEFAAPVRALDGHHSAITALALAPDSYRYVASASGDGVLLLWDLAAAACVGQYRFTSPALSLHFHPDALFLVSTHAGERGACLWVNNLRYGFVPEVVERPKERALQEIPFLHFPSSHGAAEEDGEGEDEDRKMQEVEALKAETELFDASKDIALHQRAHAQATQAALDAIPTEGLQLAGVPTSLWFNLTVLDQIKEKNQPLLPPKKKDVPFFLPTTQELRPTFLVVASSGPSAAKTSEEQDGAGRLRQADLSELTPVQRLLVEEAFDELMRYFLTSCRTAAAIDLELKRVVDYVDGSTYTAAELAHMARCLVGLLRFVGWWLRKMENVDLVQGILADVLRSHSSLLTKLGNAVVPALEEVAELQNEMRYRVDHLVSYPGCLAGTFSGSTF